MDKREPGAPPGAPPSTNRRTSRSPAAWPPGAPRGTSWAMKNNVDTWRRPWAWIPTRRIRSSRRSWRDRLGRIRRWARHGHRGVQSARGPPGEIGFDARRMDLRQAAGDLQVWIDKQLQGIGVNQETIDLFLRQQHWTLSTRMMLVQALEEMAGVQGRAAVLDTAVTAENEDQARFLARRPVAAGARARRDSLQGLLDGKPIGVTRRNAWLSRPAWTTRAGRAVATFTHRRDLTLATPRCSSRAVCRRGPGPKWRRRTGTSGKAFRCPRRCASSLSDLARPGDAPSPECFTDTRTSNEPKKSSHPRRRGKITVRQRKHGRIGDGESQNRFLDRGKTYRLSRVPANPPVKRFWSFRPQPRASSPTIPPMSGDDPWARFAIVGMLAGH